MPPIRAGARESSCSCRPSATWSTSTPTSMRSSRTASSNLPGGSCRCRRCPRRCSPSGCAKMCSGSSFEREAIPPPLAARMLNWRHSGFSVHNRVRVAAGDAEGRKSLAGYMLRAPFSLEKMSYDAARGAVIYRSRLHATLKRNFQAMPGVEWLELLCKHIPDRNEHMVRYYGRYSSRTRGAEREPPTRPRCPPRTARRSTRATSGGCTRGSRAAQQPDLRPEPIQSRLLPWHHRPRAGSGASSSS